MKVFLAYMFLSLLVGILMRRRPFQQTQLVVFGMTLIAAICYFYFGML